MRISDWSSDVCSSDLVGLISNPAYDSAMFLANMTTVPVLAIFIIAIETEFFERYQAFYRAIEAHATWREIRENHAGIIRSLNAAGRNILLLQSVIAALALLRSEEHTSELQSLMRHPYAVFCLKKNKKTTR